MADSSTPSNSVRLHRVLRAPAERVYRAIVGAAQKLPQFPALGRPGRHPETRELSVSGLPYLIVYEDSAEAVTILAVFHTSRDLTQALQERISVSYSYR